MITAASQIRTRFGATLGLNPRVAEKVERDFISPLVSRFFSARGIGAYRRLPPDVTLHELDFGDPGAYPIGELYKLLFGTTVVVGKKRVTHEPLYCLTLDESVCPVTCVATRVQYATIDLANTPIAYILLLPLSRLFEYIRSVPAEPIAISD